MDLMLLHKVGAVVVVSAKKKKMEAQGRISETPIATGMITKSDILQAYRNRIDIDAPCQKIMGDKHLVCCHPSDDRDQVASILERNRTHHVVVVDENHSSFMGIVSSWDVAAECAKDNRFWPYLRGEDGKIPFPEHKIEKHVPLPDPYDPNQPTTVLNHKHEKDTFMDDLDLEAFQ